MFWKITASELRGANNEAVHLWVEYRLNEKDKEPFAVEDFDAPSEWTPELISEDLDKHAMLLEPKPEAKTVDFGALVGMSRNV